MFYYICIIMQQQGRVYFLDYLRALACFMVMLVHASECYYSDGAGISIAGRATGIWVAVYDGMSRCAVPLFVMISAYLLVPVAGSVGVFFRKRLVRVVIPFAVWSVLYATLPVVWGAMTVDEMLAHLTRLLYNFNFSSGHMWFIYMLVGLYLFMPVISPWLERCTRRQEQWFIAVWLISTFLGYMNFALGEVYGAAFWNEFHVLYYFSGFLGYLVVAHYIRTKLAWTRALKIKAGALMFIAGAVFTCLSFYYMMPRAADFYEIEIGWRFCSPNVALESIGLFLLFDGIFARNKGENRLVRQLSVNSYGMYLMHMFILVYAYSLIDGHIANGLAIPLIALATYIVAFILTRLLTLLPGGKYVVG